MFAPKAEILDMKIAVAMSGGVDSSAAAALLKEQGHELVGFTMQLWNQRRGISVDENGDPLPALERVDTLPNAGSSIKAAADESETPKLTTPKTTREEKYAREFIKGMPDRSYDIESARKFLKEYAEKDATPVRGGVPRRGNRTMDSIVTPSEMHEETPMLNSATPKLVDDVVAAAGAVSDEQLSEVRKVLHQTVENEFQAIVQDTEEVVRLAEAERKRQAALNVVDARIAKLRTPHSKRLLK